MQPITRGTLGRVGGYGKPDNFVQIPIPESVYPYFKNPVGGPISTCLLYTSDAADE